MANEKDRNENRRPRGESSGATPRVEPASATRALPILDHILKDTDPMDPQYHRLLLLRHQLEADDQQFSEAQELIQKYDEAYTKLTAPANRVAVFLSKNEDGTANIAMGDNDWYTNVDPNVELDSL